MLALGGQADSRSSATQERRGTTQMVVMPSLHAAPGSLAGTQQVAEIAQTTGPKSGGLSSAVQ